MAFKTVNLINATIKKAIKDPFYHFILISGSIFNIKQQIYLFILKMDPKFDLKKLYWYYLSYRPSFLYRFGPRETPTINWMIWLIYQFLVGNSLFSNWNDNIAGAWSELPLQIQKFFRSWLARMTLIPKINSTGLNICLVPILKEAKQILMAAE